MVMILVFGSSDPGSIPGSGFFFEREVELLLFCSEFYQDTDEDSPESPLHINF